MSSDEHSAHLQAQLVRGQIEFARDAIKYAILINGAAVIAMMTFLGHFKEGQITPDTAEEIGCSLLIFGTGVLLGSFSFLGAYITQTFVNEGHTATHNKIGVFFRYFSVVTTLLSLVLFFFLEHTYLDKIL